MRVTNEQIKILPIKEYEVIVDNDIYEKIKTLRWNANKWSIEHCGNTYFFAYIKELAGESRNCTYLHRYIMGCTNGDGNHVDHINGNTLDNRRSNLRICTQAENNRNTSRRVDNKSGYKGVYWHKGRSKWRVQIKYNNKIIHLGYYLNKKDAAIAYNNKAIELHGEFASLNVIEKEPTE